MYRLAIRLSAHPDGAGVPNDITRPLEAGKAVRERMRIDQGDVTEEEGPLCSAGVEDGGEGDKPRSTVGPRCQE